MSSTARRVLVTSNGCDCEDYFRAVDAGRSDAAWKIRVHVAPLRSPQGHPEKLKKIQQGKVMPLFWVYGDDALGDMILDLSQETALPAELVLGGRRRATIAEWQWRRLLVHLTVERWHQTPRRIFGWRQAWRARA